ncbi:MAG: Arylsulfatase [Verrucomicrobiota bacterium]
MMSPFLTLVLAFAEPAAKPATAPKPNIVFILADDLGYGELGCYGQKKIRTPNIDLLAQDGMRLTNARSGAPVCAPARCVLMTGKHLGQSYVRGNKDAGNESQLPIPDEEITIPEILAPQGYTSACIGKWGLGGFQNSGNPNKQGFDHFFGYICQRQAHSFYPDHLWSDGVRVELNNKPAVAGHGRLKDASGDFGKFQGSDHSSERMMADAEAWLARRGTDKKPFFLYLSLTEPHVAMQPPQRLVDSYPKEWDAHPYLGDKGYVPHPRPRAGYAAMITYLDEHVGRLRKALKQHGLDDNTLIIFSSDNGATHNVGGVDTEFFSSVGALRGRKGSVFDGGLRVPMIAVWPGKIKAGSLSSAALSFHDIMSTLAEVSGAKPAPASTGRSIVPVLSGRESEYQAATCLWDFPEYGGQQAVLLDGRYMVLRCDLQKSLMPWQVYDVLSDLGQEKDLAASEAGQALIQRAEVAFTTQRTSNSNFPILSVDGGAPPKN